MDAYYRAQYPPRRHPETLMHGRGAAPCGKKRGNVHFLIDTPPRLAYDAAYD